MNLKDIVVYLDPEEAAATRLEVAIDLAVRHQAVLIGFYVISPIGVNAYSLEEGAMTRVAEYVKSEKQRRRDEAERLGQSFRQRTATVKLQSDWQCIDGSNLDHPERRGGFADLVVIGQEARVELGQTPGDVILNCGRPTLLVPTTLPAKQPVGKRCLVAWNDTRESVRALNDALPLLHQAELVHLVSIHSADTGSEKSLLTTETIRHLQRHDIKAEHVIIESRGDAGDELLGHAEAQRMDFMVMGAYGHSRLREFVLGGVTRKLLQETSIPVLFSH